MTPTINLFGGKTLFQNQQTSNLTIPPSGMYPKDKKDY